MRKPGNYKVKIDNQWTIAEWILEEDYGYWILNGDEDACLTDRYFDEIGELLTKTNT